MKPPYETQDRTEISQDYLCSLDLNLHFSSVNTAFLATLGLTSAEVLGQELTTFIHPEDKELTKLEILKPGPSSNIISRLITRNGDIKTIEWKKFNDFQEGVILLVGEEVDPLSKEATEQIEFHKIYSQLPLPCEILDCRKGQIISVNDRFCELLGYRQSELLNDQGFRRNEISENPISILEKLNEANPKGSMIPTPVELKTKTGAVRSTICHGIQLDESGSRVALSYLDITDFEVVAKKVLDSDRIVNLALDMFCVAGYDGYFKYLNPAWERTLGWSTKELLSKPWIEFVHPEDRDKTENIKTVIIDGKEVFQFENRYICKNGSIKWLSWNSQPFPQENIMIGAIRDVTRIKENASELTRVTELLETTQQIAKVGGWEYDIKKDSLYWTSQVYRIHDLSPTEFFPTVENATLFYTPKSQIILNQAVEAAIDEQKGYDLNLKLKTAKGRIIHVRTNCEVEVKDGSVTKLIGSIQDITKEKEAELEIIKLSKAVSQSPESIVITDPNGLIEYVNPTFTKVTGYTYKEAIGKKPGLLQSGEHSKAFYKNMWDTISCGKTWYGEFLNKKKNGESFWERANITPIKNEDGDIINYLAIKEDITENKKTQEDLKEAKLRAETGEKYLNAIIQNVGDPLFVKNEKSEIILCNDAYCKHVNQNRDEIIGKTLMLSSKLKSTKDFIKEDQIVLETGQSTLSEETLFVEGKKEKYCATKKTRYIDGTGNKLIICTTRDITELVKYRNHLQSMVDERTQEIELATKELQKAHDQLKASKMQLERSYEKEKELGELKSKLVSTVSHQFRTPLTVIQSNISLMEMNLDLLDEPIRKRFSKSFDRINKESRRMTSLMSDVLTLGKINGNAMKSRFESIDLVEIAKDLTESFNQMAKPAKIKLEVVNAPKKVWADFNQVNHILLNVLDNAQKYSLDRGDVSFRIDFGKDRAHIIIKDQGIGIPQSDINKIYQPFSRGENTEGIQGTGLGLSIVEEYVQMNKGQILFESTQNVGTTFHIKFNYPKNGHA